MRKRWLVLAAFLFVFWLIISAGFDSQHLLLGLVLAVITVAFWHNLGPQLPKVLCPAQLLICGRCFFLIIIAVLRSNIAVAKTLLASKPAASPVFLIMQPPLTSRWGRVLLATAITLTPGTVTVDVHPQTGRFIVHALTEEMAISLLYWDVIQEIRRLETYQRRRPRHVVEPGGAHASDSLGVAAGDYRADGH